MTKIIDSQALAKINKALAIAGPGSQFVLLEDATVDQVLSVSDIVRRSRTLANTGGIHVGVLRNIHGAAGSLVSQINPYDVATAQGAWLSPIPDSLEVWLLGASVVRVSGTLGFGAGAILTMGIPSANVAFGINDSGANVPIPAGIEIVLHSWLTVMETATATAIDGAGNAWFPIGIRIPRALATDVLLTFISDAAALATWDCRLLLGLFPISFGQDGVV